ncbi:hypothetical protein PUN28_003645 [Cardiocondyla obscurior]|uniref:Ribosomal protein L28 n=1 Tax=Cardiocondyla obscurior TaxID=286306 RepID=A0AAW2GP54_9HYME
MRACFATRCAPTVQRNVRKDLSSKIARANVVHLKLKRKLKKVQESEEIKLDLKKLILKPKESRRLRVALRLARHLSAEEPNSKKSSK